MDLISGLIHTDHILSLPLGLKQLENSFSFLLNNRKKQCEACNIVQPNSGALRFISYSFISLHCNFPGINAAFVGIAFMYFDLYISTGLHVELFDLLVLQFLFVCFSVKMVFPDTSHWMCSPVSSWMLSLMFQFISTLVFHSILQNQKCIGCFSLTNRAFMFFRHLNCFSPLLSLLLYFCFVTLPIMLCFFNGKDFIVGWRHQTLIFACPEKHFKLKLKCHIAVWIIMNPLILVLGLPLFSLTGRPQMWQR